MAKTASPTRPPQSTPSTQFTGALLRMPPQAVEAEASVLGSLLLDVNAIIKVADIIRPNDFYRPDHQTVFEAILNLYEHRRAIDVVTLTEELEGTKKLEHAGGASAIASLTRNVPSAANVVHYAEIVREKGVLRRLITTASAITELGYQEERPVDEVVDEAERLMFEVAERSVQQKFEPVKEILTRSFERIEDLHEHRGKTRGVPTGFKDLDNLLSGFQNSDLIIIAARPSMGKTSLALNIAHHAATHHKVPIGFFSLEQSKDQLVDRLIAGEAAVDSWKLRTGNLANEDFERLNYAMGVLADSPIFIDDQPSLTVMEVRTKARRLQAEHGLGMVVVDYLQLMQGRQTREANRVQEVSDISRGLKGLARELNVPVVALSQLSREVEKRPNHIPQLSDLRESGCLAGETLVPRADTGELVRIDELAKTGQSIPIYAMDDQLRVGIHTLTKAFPSGQKPVFALKLASGRIITASANHPFYTIDGWKRLDELKIGVCLATYLREQRERAFSMAFKKQVEARRDEAVIPTRQFHAELGWAYSGTQRHKNGVTRERLAHILTAVQDEFLQDLVRSDLYWDEVVAIEPLGVQEVYDATVPGVHNFVANDIVVHNSLEQDCDVCLFIYREDYYNPETENKNVAKILIRKHRNGPVGECELFFMAEQTKFRTIDRRHAAPQAPASE